MRNEHYYQKGFWKKLWWILFINPEKREINPDFDKKDKERLKEYWRTHKLKMIIELLNELFP